MARRDKHHHLPKFQTLPSSPTHSFSSSSSDFEFTISVSPRKSSAAFCPADELFYKGQILPLHLSPMVRTILLASSSSSSDTTTTASRDSTGSATDSHSSFSSDLSHLHPKSSRPSSVTEDALEGFNFKCINNNVSSLDKNPIKKPSKFSLSKFSSVFRRDPKNISSSSTSSQKGTSKSAKEVISKYFKKVKPLYEKISQKQQVKVPSSSSTTAAKRMATSANPTLCMKKDGSTKERDPISAHQNKSKENHKATMSHSFSGNTRHTRRSCISSCPSSIRSSPNHSGIIHRNGFTPTSTTITGTYADNSSMEELQSAIQGAIAHCKGSMLQNKTMVSNEGF